MWNFIGYIICFLLTVSLLTFGVMNIMQTFPPGVFDNYFIRNKFLLWAFGLICCIAGVCSFLMTFYFGNKS